MKRLRMIAAGLFAWAIVMLGVFAAFASDEVSASKASFFRDPVNLFFLISDFAIVTAGVGVFIATLPRPNTKFDGAYLLRIVELLLVMYGIGVLAFMIHVSVATSTNAQGWILTAVVGTFFLGVWVVLLRRLRRVCELMLRAGRG